MGLPLCWKSWTEGTGCPSHVTPEDLIDTEDALSWLKSTEAEKILLCDSIRSGVSFVRILASLSSVKWDIDSPILYQDRLRSYFESMVLPLVNMRIPGCDAALAGFIRAYCLVSSRAFLVDAFHGLAMVPIADA